MPIGWRMVGAGVAVAVALAAPPAAIAAFKVNYAGVDTSRWSCRLCPFDRATRQAGKASAGALQSTGGEMRFGRDNGIDRAGGYLDLNGDYRMATRSGLTLELSGRGLGLDSRQAALRVRKANRYGATVRYREIPRNVARDGRSPFVGTGMLSLPDDWIAAFSTSGMTQLAATSQPLKLATERQRSDLDAWLRLAPRLTLRAGYFIERKRGTEQAFRDAFHQATALPLPIDHRTESATAGLHFEHPRATAALSYHNRRFSNDEEALNWRNPYGSPASIGRSATAPSNRADTLSFVSRVRLGERTTINATAARSKAKQNAPFLARTTNPSIAPLKTSPHSLNGERASDSYAVNLVTRPTRHLRLSLAHALVDRDDRRPEIVIAPVLGDLFATPEITALGYSFKRRRTDIAARYNLPRNWRLTAGFRRLANHRTNLEIDANKENHAWLEAAGEIGAGWRLSARHERGDRSASEFRANTLNNPLTRRFYQAERRSREWRGGIRFQPNGSSLSAGFEVEHGEHDYPDSALGLQREATEGWFLDVAYSAGSAASLSAFYGEQARRSKTAGSQAFPTQDWRYDTKDKVTTAGLRLKADRLLHSAIGLTLDYARSNGDGVYSTDFEDLTSRFPSLASRHESVDLRLRYAWRAQTALVLRYYYERFRAADWAIDGLGQDAIRNVLSLRRSSPKYRNHLFALSVEREL